ncbi:MAG: T9SS type A sorting domain-containing protein, partial [Flavobacteriales bacterium]|nr:T9SS type A sorting domain-containing protein [Flavobacteriales bacterium]
DVLLDVLQADDDNGDITDGTPNGDAIVEGFAIHGITLITNAIFNHTPLEASLAEEEIEVSATIILDFPFINYLDEGQMYYRINGETEWQVAGMENTLGNTYTATIPAQPEGTVIAYYLGLVDTFGNSSSTKPIAANEADPNIPYYILVGLEDIMIHDNDFSEPWGQWDTGVSGDNNTTGDWEVNIPIGSFSDDGSNVAPDTQTTPDGELCFLTGQSPSPTGGIGENDVDGGHTTLRSPVIDLTGMTTPVFTYERWYANAPPTGANPGTDWWQVQLSDDGGNSWVYLENSRTQDISWRRNAFRVEDHVDVTNEFRIQMIASDSTFIGQNLDGGSLIEAAMDDFILWDLGIPDNINEVDATDAFQLYPNPADEQVTIAFDLMAANRVTIEITDMTGRTVFEENYGELFVGNHRKTIPTKSLPAGMYIMSARMGSNVLTQSFQVID